MVEYRRSAHAIYDIKYHVAWITKYRYKMRRGRAAARFFKNCGDRRGGVSTQTIASAFRTAASVRSRDAPSGSVKAMKK